MKKIILAAIATLITVGAWAKEQTGGMIISESSVACGSEASGKKETVQMLCQEYVIRTDTTEYHVRQPKQEHKSLLPVNTPIEFTLDKDKMKLKVNGKNYEMLVVSESAVAIPKQ